MLSCYINKNKVNTSDANPKKLITNESLIHNKSIKRNYQPKSGILSRQTKNKCSIKKQNHRISKVNDQNCSLNANTTQVQAFGANKPLEEIRNKQQQGYDEQVKIKQVINLKKKIKKCSSDQMVRKQNNFRQKVSFIRKRRMTTNPTTNEQNQINQQSLIYIQPPTTNLLQTYPVYRDRQIFKGSTNRQLSNIMLTQRMDNDQQSQWQQVQRFVDKMKNELLFHVQRIKISKQQSRAKQQSRTIINNSAQEKIQ